jgi:uncharacterized protein involved in exopolysaccharide biosynthesis
MSTLESSFFGQTPDDAASPIIGRPLSWLDRLSAWLPITANKPVGGPVNTHSFMGTSGYGSAPGGFGDGAKRLVPEPLSRWSAGLRSPWGSGGPGGFMKREGWFITGVALFVFFFTVVYANTAFVSKYDSKAMLIVKDSAITSSYVSNNNNGLPSSTTSSSASNPVLNMIGLINSTSVRNSLYDYFVQFQPAALKKYKIENLEDWEAFYGDGSAFLKAKNMPGTDLIQINFTWDDPKTAREAMRTLLTAFQNESLNINQAEQRNRSHYLDAKVDELTKKLQVLRGQKSQYKTKMSSVNLQKQSEELTKARIDMGTQLNGVMAKARGKASESARYERMLNMSADDAVQAIGLGLDSSMSKLYDQLYSLKQTEANLSASLTDKNPRVIEVKEAIKSVESSIKKEETRLIGNHHKPKQAFADTTRGELVKEMAKSQAEANSLQQQALEMQGLVNSLEGQITNFPAIEEGLTNIEQEERYLSNALDSLKQKALEAHIKEAETLSNIFIVDQPSLPDKEKFPGKNHILLLGFISGFALGTGLAFLKHKLRFSGTDNAGREDDTLFDVLTPSQKEDTLQQQPRKGNVM